MTLSINTPAVTINLPGVTTINIQVEHVHVTLPAPEGESLEAETAAKEALGKVATRLEDLATPNPG